ncbi:YciI family protein [Saccharopolyspora sp. K220]|uniref:YciI family protein n=1 Tax=Saccharopolyspora soli TaxID=2926618 RepID=UPI001F56C1EA|nr:YciI family protein [Saccharopolyspora soli]MCI2422055.1 YciI family protein [Saccharopolyspora soli]
MCVLVSRIARDGILHLLLLRYKASEQEAAPFVAAHVEFLEQHHGDGTFVLSGQTIPSELGGAVLARGVDRAGIEKIVAQDPFVVGGVGKYLIMTIDPGRVHPALAALLGADASRVRG